MAVSTDPLGALQSLIMARNLPPVAKPDWSKLTHRQILRRITLLPTLEAQFIAWISLVRDYPAAHTSHLWRTIDLARAGFHVYLRVGEYTIGSQELIMLCLANMQIPPRYYGRGWFTCFRQLAQALNPFAGIVYESVLNEYLARHLEDHGCQRLYTPEQPWFFELRQGT